MSAAPIAHPNEYLELDRIWDEKREYRNGGIYAIAGRLRPEDFIINHIQCALTEHLSRKGCHVLKSQC